MGGPLLNSQFIFLLLKYFLFSRVPYIFSSFFYFIIHVLDLMVRGKNTKRFLFLFSLFYFISKIFFHFIENWVYKYWMAAFFSSTLLSFSCFFLRQLVSTRANTHTHTHLHGRECDNNVPFLVTFSYENLIVVLIIREKKEKRGKIVRKNFSACVDV